MLLGLVTARFAARPSDSFANFFFGLFLDFRRFLGPFLESRLRNPIKNQAPLPKTTKRIAMRIIGGLEFVFPVEGVAGVALGVAFAFPCWLEEEPPRVPLSEPLLVPLPELKVGNVTGSGIMLVCTNCTSEEEVTPVEEVAITW